MESQIAVLDGAVDLACSDASGAYVSFSYFAIVIDSNSLNVGIPFSLGMSVGMGYIVARNLSLATYFALFRHLPHLLTSKVFILTSARCYQLRKSDFPRTHDIIPS